MNTSLRFNKDNTITYYSSLFSITIKNTRFIDKREFNNFSKNDRIILRDFFIKHYWKESFLCYFNDNDK